MEKKFITIQVDEKLHYEVKKRAIESHLSIKDWILIAIAQKMQSDLNKEVK